MDPQRNTDEQAWREADAAYVAECFGRAPKGVAAVALRDRAGRAAVITNQPLLHTPQQCQPQPTLYWLVDPQLSTRISELERKGGVRAIEAALAADEALMQAHLADNLAYAQQRMGLLGEHDRAIADEKNMLDVLQNTGIGGVANHRALKCLHAQFAYHLARRDTGTTVGRLMQQRFAVRLEL